MFAVFVLNRKKVLCICALYIPISLISSHSLPTPYDWSRNVKAKVLCRDQNKSIHFSFCWRQFFSLKSECWNLPPWRIEPMSQEWQKCWHLSTATPAARIQALPETSTFVQHHLFSLAHWLSRLLRFRRLRIQDRFWNRFWDRFRRSQWRRSKDVNLKTLKPAFVSSSLYVSKLMEWRLWEVLPKFRYCPFGFEWHLDDTQTIQNAALRRERFNLTKPNLTLPYNCKDA